MYQHFQGFYFVINFLGAYECNENLITANKGHLYSKQRGKTTKI